MKTMKRVLLAVLMAVACLGLCSCNYLDEIRERSFFINEDGTISYLDGTYEKVSGHNAFGFVSSTWGYAAEADVPLLLVEEFGWHTTCSSDKMLISMSGDLYIRTDAPEDLRAQVENIKLDCYGISVMVPTEAGNVHWEYRILDEKAMALLNDILSQPSASSFPETETGYILETANFFRCDRNLYFSGSSYELQKWSEDCYVLYSWDDAASYLVPVESGQYLMDSLYGASIDSKAVELF